MLGAIAHDGDALVLPTRRLLRILQQIRQSIPGVERVASYCLPLNLRKKLIDELKELAEAGLTMAYVGAESGDDEVLRGTTRVRPTGRP